MGITKLTKLEKHFSDVEMAVISAGEIKEFTKREVTKRNPSGQSV